MTSSPEIRPLAEIIANTDWSSNTPLSASIFVVACSFIPGLDGVAALADKLNSCASDAALAEKLSAVADLLVQHDRDLAALKSVPAIVSRIERMLPELGQYSELRAAVSTAMGLFSIDAREDAITQFINVRIDNLRMEVRARSGSKIELDDVHQVGDGANFTNVNAITTVKNSTFSGPTSAASLGNVEIRDARVELNNGVAAMKVVSSGAGLILTPGKVIIGGQISGDGPYGLSRKPED